MSGPRSGERDEVLRVLGSFRRELLIVGIFSMVANLLMLAPTLYMLQVYDRVLASQSELTLLALSLITLFLFAVMAFAEWMRSRVLVAAGVRLDEQLSTRVFNASFEVQLAQSGRAQSRAFNDLIQLRQFLTGNGIFAFFDTPWVPVYVAVLFILHPWLGWMAVVFALVQGALTAWGHWYGGGLAESAQRSAGEANAFLQNKLRNSEVIEAMGMMGHLQRRWQQRASVAVDLAGQAQTRTHRVTAVSKFVRYSQQSLALGLGALLVIDGQLSPGAMIAANVLTTRALAPLDMLVGVWRGFVIARDALARLRGLLGQFPPRVAPEAPARFTGAVETRNLSATAMGRAKPILEGVSLALRPGTVTVVLGPSGSGKSTLARAMLGIWPKVSGEVLLDGVPVADWPRGQLGPQLGYLPQDVELFEGSIAENIARFAELDAVAVVKAARTTGLHETILRFPKGYDTPIGEAGGMLSGGQRQRLGLARAVYGEPALVVLDEPNANLDDVGEAALARTVGELRDLGKSVLLITHRPGIVMAADQLVVLQDGRVALAGPRDEVLARLRAPQTEPVRIPAPAA
ncbi:MAG: type I secretion system permease/ATPase [Rhodoferax sp.]|nr:type I secretion system permease/ATPase [Rhodoferax sp.]